MKKIRDRALALALVAFIAAIPLAACERGNQAASSKKTGSASNAAAALQTTEGGELSHLLVYKSPTCGCCGEWIKRATAAGLSVHAEDVADLNAVKHRFNIAPQYQACHTAISVTGQYIFEGHVPPHLVERFLKNPPEGARGLATPGMPAGSPGMEIDERKDAYDVLLLKSDGSTEVYARMIGAEEQKG